MSSRNPFRDKADRNPFRLSDDIKSQLAAEEAELSKNETPSPFTDKIGRSFLNAAGAFPSAAGQVLSQGLAGTEAALEGGVSVLTGGDFDFEERANRNMQFPPFAQLNNIPKPTIEGAEAVLPAARAAIDQGIATRQETGQQPPLFEERFGPAFDEELGRINQEEQRLDDKFPVRRTVGDALGVAGTLFLGRLGFSKGIKDAEQKLIKELADIPAGAKGFINETVKGSAVRSIARGAGRTVETGFEAAAIELLRGEDPHELVGYAMASQATGSGILATTKMAGKHPLWTSAIGLAAIIQLGKETLPGGRDSFIASVEAGFEKVQLGLVLGAAAGAVGGGRLRGNDGALERNFPAIADSVQSLVRTTMISLAEDYFNAEPDEQETIDAVLGKLQEDPGFFGPEITNKLELALQSGNLTEALREVQ